MRHWAWSSPLDVALRFYCPRGWAHPVTCVNVQHQTTQLICLIQEGFRLNLTRHCVVCVKLADHTPDEGWTPWTNSRTSSGHMFLCRWSPVIQQQPQKSFYHFNVYTFCFCCFYLFWSSINIPIDLWSPFSRLF